MSNAQFQSADDYRPDIDGLRALAILPVVLFHARVPGFSGGFVGVDVFFVISGFLITSIIDKEVRAGGFSIARFYERRARRILPALFVVMACCSILAALWYFPDQYLAYSGSLIAATLFVSSFLFRREDGYFDLASDEKPLLHTWSLSVEEIYYVFFPMVLVWAGRGADQRRLGILIGMALISFAASVIGLHQNPTSKSVFFLPHFRAWEFLMGAVLALTAPRLLRGQRLADAASVLGVLMILAAVFAYSGSTVFPGLAALLPCAGAALVIAAGRGRATLAGRMLGSRPVVFVGLISYSLYLWHWPLLVFSESLAGAEHRAWQTVGVILLSTLLAALTWRFVERPFRGKNGWLSSRQVFLGSLLGMLLFVGLGVQGMLSQGWASRFPEEVVTILFAANDKDPRLKECLSIRSDAEGCIYGADDAPPVIALWGDSHAFGYAAMLGDLARRHNTAIQVFTMPACPPLPDWRPISQDWRDSCARFQRLAQQRILESLDIGTVLVAANYTHYDTKDGTFEQALDGVVAKLSASGKRVALIDPTPLLAEKVPEVLGRQLRAGESPTELTQPLSDFQAATGAASKLLSRVAQRNQAARIQPQSVLCDTRACFFYRDKTVYYYDDHHLSLSGAARLEPLFEPLFSQAGTGSDRHRAGGGARSILGENASDR